MGIVLNKQHEPEREEERYKGPRRTQKDINVVCERERESKQNIIIFKISHSSMIWIAGIILFYKIYLPGNQPLRWYESGTACGKSNTFSLNSISFFHALCLSHLLSTSIRWFTFILSTNRTEFLLAALHSRVLSLLSSLYFSIWLILRTFFCLCVYVYPHTPTKRETFIRMCAYQNPFKYGYSIFMRMLSNLSCKCKH